MSGGASPGSTERPAPWRVAILAGRGSLPVAVARSIERQGGVVHIIAIEGEAERSIEAFSHVWVKWGQFGRWVREMRWGGPDLVIIGAVSRPDLRTVRPDLGFLLSLPEILKQLRGGDDSILSRAVRFFESKGLKVIGAHEAAPDLVAGDGILGGIAPGPGDRQDIDTGFRLLDALGPLDVGQAAVVAAGRVIAVEGVEGTDRVLERAGQIMGPRSAGSRGVLVKRPKPGQELRVDMPTIGPRTVALAAVAGLAGIATEAGHVLLAEREALLAAADAKGLFIAGVSSPTPSFPGKREERRSALPRAALDDVALGAAVIGALRPFGAGRAVVVARRHVLTVAAAESTAEMLARVGALRQWGSSSSARRQGVLVVDASALPTAAEIESWLAPAASVHLAAVALFGIGGEAAAAASLAAAAARHGLTIVAAPPS